MNAQNRKLILLSIICLLTAFMVSCTPFQKPDYMEIENIQMQMRSELGMLNLVESQFCITEDGNCFLIDNGQLWFYQDRGCAKVSINAKDVPHISGLSGVAANLVSRFTVKNMAPISKGVVFLSERVLLDGIYEPMGLYYTDGEDTTLICENATVFCVDGERALYYDAAQSCVFSFDGELTQAYLNIPEMNASTTPVQYMLANKDWVLLITWEGVFQYNRNTEELCLNQANSLSNVSNNPSVLYDNKLVLFSKMQNKLTIFDLITAEENSLELYTAFSSINTKISGKLHNDSFYLSIRNLSDLWEQPFECTLEINRETDQIDIVDDQFYENLLCTDTALYGGRIHKMTKVCELKTGDGTMSSE